MASDSTELPNLTATEIEDKISMLRMPSAFDNDQALLAWLEACEKEIADKREDQSSALGTLPANYQDQ